MNFKFYIKDCSEQSSAIMGCFFVASFYMYRESCMCQTRWKNWIRALILHQQFSPMDRVDRHECNEGLETLGQPVDKEENT